MEKEKLGNFVCLLRKEKQMTQKEMAERLGITDKAVSKWERGLSYPDISMLEPLAELLDVSVMELLQGQRIQKESILTVQEAQKMVDESLSLSDDEIHRKHVRSKTVILTGCVLLMFLISLLLNIHNLMQKQTDAIPVPDPNAAAYETVEDENGKPVFRNPSEALSQIREESRDKLPKEWTRLLEIMENTYETEDSE